ncbi:MAG: GDSL-type esterase/lipase family protein [Verrucomicrobiales bacterium]|jgi:N-acetylglucosamine-6-sulfatase|nr:GDSL-type esterase/lipase family protein [Verrucomicrobiales bacterium]
MKKTLTGLKLLLLTLPLTAAETIYQDPVPAGANRAAVAAPRNDWYRDVQNKFTKYGGKPADIVFEGDSITNRWEGAGREMWKKHFEGRAADFGIEGDRVENALWRLSKGQVDGINPKIIVIMLGTNNTYFNSAEEIAGGLKLLVAEYQKRCPLARVILMGIFPRGKDAADKGRVKVAAINDIIKGYADNDKVFFVDIGDKFITADGDLESEVFPGSDTVHPSEKGYEIWTEAILPIINKYAP